MTNPSDSGSDAEVIFGRHPVLEALEAGEQIDEILLAAGAKQHGALGRIASLARERGVPIKHAPRPALDRLASRSSPSSRSANHQGVIARAAPFPYSDLDTILASAIQQNQDVLLLALDQIQDVHNLGSLIRSAEAAGVHGLLIPPHHAAGITPAVRRASARAVAPPPIARPHLPAPPHPLSAPGIKILGLDADAPLPYTEADLTGPLCLVVGSEGSGLRRIIARRCQLTLSLPMHGQITSLNASVAGSILLYESLRQRQGQEPS